MENYKENPSSNNTIMIINNGLSNIKENSSMDINMEKE